MRHRGQFSAKERDSRSKLTKLVSNQPILCGSLVTMSRVCGNPRCKCVLKGEKHVSLYLSIREKGKRKMIYVPSELESQVRLRVEKYQQCQKLMEKISQHTLDRLLKSKSQER